MTVGNRRVRWALALAAGSAVLTLTAACGGSGSGGDGSGTAAAGQQGSGFTAYADCLRQQGIAVPDNRPTGRPSVRPSGRPSSAPFPGASGRPGGAQPGGFAGLRPSGVDDATWQQAQEACRSVLPSGGPGRNRDGNGPGGGSGTNPAYANCLSDHGMPRGATPDPSDPTASAALEACKALKPAPAGS